MKIARFVKFAFLSTKLDSTFRQSPIEIITFDNIEYTFYDYRVTWEEARIICLEYESELATLDVEENAIFITQQTSENILGNI